MNERNGTNWHERARLASLEDDDLIRLAEAVEREKKMRRRGMRRLIWNPELRAWERSAL